MPNMRASDQPGRHPSPIRGRVPAALGLVLALAVTSRVDAVEIPAETGMCPAAQLAQAAAVRLAPTVPGLRAEVLTLALRAFFRARCRGELHSDVLSVIDYTLASSERRLWGIDVARSILLFRERVAHGRGSGNVKPERFSNRPESRATSLGLFVTRDTYRGHHGYSLRLDGLETGVNDHARERGIVVHPAEYMSDRFVSQNGRAGRSYGCPALDPATSSRVIDLIKGGSALWAYYPDREWLEGSRYLAGD
jgi:hypothetical protein